MKVESTKRILKVETFDDLLSAGSNQDVLDYLKNENLNATKKNFKFSSLLYLLKDKDFFTETIKILKERAIVNEQVWQYAFYHKDDKDLMAECLRLSPWNYFQELGTHFTSKLVTINQHNCAGGFTKHLEYHPMVNNRVHRIGKEGTNQILNPTFSDTYDDFLASVVQKPGPLSTEDKMTLVYYLQLQDRI